MRRMVAAALLIAMTAGCSTPSLPVAQTHVQQPVNQGIGAEDVLSAIRAAGIEATLGGEIPKDVSSFGVMGQAIKLGTETLQVYVFPNEDEQNRVLIGAGGHEISYGNRSAIVDWIAPPHIYRQRNVIVTFATQNEQLATKVQKVVERLQYNSSSPSEFPRWVGTVVVSELPPGQAVVDLTNGHRLPPLAGATVKVLEQNIEKRTDSEGAVTFSLPLGQTPGYSKDEGVYTFVVTSPKYPFQTTIKYRLTVAEPKFEIHFNPDQNVTLDYSHPPAR